MDMAKHPLPPGCDNFTAGQDFRVVRTLDGHIGTNVEEDGCEASDNIRRANQRNFDEAWLGGTDYAERTFLNGEDD